MHGAVEAFVVARLLVRDRDAVTASPTVEVAHEALLADQQVRLRRRAWWRTGSSRAAVHGIRPVQGGPPDR